MHRSEFWPSSPGPFSEWRARSDALTLSERHLLSCDLDASPSRRRWRDVSVCVGRPRSPASLVARYALDAATAGADATMTMRYQPGVLQGGMRWRISRNWLALFDARSVYPDSRASAVVAGVEYDSADVCATLRSTTQGGALAASLAYRAWRGLDVGAELLFATPVRLSVALGVRYTHAHRHHPGMATQVALDVVPLSQQCTLAFVHSVARGLAVAAQIDANPNSFESALRVGVEYRTPAAQSAVAPPPPTLTMASLWHIPAAIGVAWDARRGVTLQWGLRVGPLAVQAYGTRNVLSDGVTAMERSQPWGLRVVLSQLD